MIIIVKIIFVSYTKKMIKLLKRLFVKKRTVEYYRNIFQKEHARKEERDLILIQQHFEEKFNRCINCSSYVGLCEDIIEFGRCSICEPVAIARDIVKEARLGHKWLSERCCSEKCLIKYNKERYIWMAM
jgi:hypothetical protein